MLFYFIQKITWYICNFFNRYFFHLQIKGAEHVDRLQTGGVIFIANHSSKWDSFFVGSSMPQPFFKKMKGLKYMAYAKYANRQWYSGYIRLVGAYPVYSCGGDYDKSLKETIEILKSNYSLVMFPTGKRLGEFDSAEARPGVAYLAQNLNPLIIPVYIANSHHIRFSEFCLRRRRVSLTFGAPFRWTEVATAADDLRTRAVKIMKRVAELAG